MNDTKVKKQIIDKIKESNNVLIALNSSPSVDELSAALGLTLAINKIDKHATAVFSGSIPTAIEFLQPEKTFENSVLSLQDFIIALDKEKADHLRYKVDGDMVKIFITPYRTTIDESDLEFSQGDYNVDFVIAIGVQSTDSLDKALSSHGQILEDATVASVSLSEDSVLGTINWGDKNASSYCEIITGLVKDLQGGKEVLDEQISTALLTGIVAATDRFSNEKTSSRVMTTAADLMSAGANQQLIAVQLEQAEEISATQQAGSDSEPQPEPQADTPPEPAEPEQHNGELDIRHDYRGTIEEVTDQVEQVNQTTATQQAASELNRQLHSPITTTLPPARPVVDYEETPVISKVHQDEPRVEPSLGGTLNATAEEAAVAKRYELEREQNQTILSHDNDHFLTDQPTHQAPLSATVDTAQNNEPKVRDIFADSPNEAAGIIPELPVVQRPVAHDTSAPAPAMPSFQANSLPPAPTFPAQPAAPTLAEIDSKNRAQGDLLGDVHAAYTNNYPGSTLPPLPPAPPMPDMSTLPPLPNLSSPQGFHDNGSSILAEPLGSTLPPASAPVQQDKSDPGQFKIPGAQ